MIIKYLTIIHSVCFLLVTAVYANTNYITDAEKLKSINEENQEGSEFQKFTDDYTEILKGSNTDQQIEKYQRYYGEENLKHNFKELVDTQEIYTQQNSENMQIERFSINQLMVFVSSSMPENVLQQYAEQSRKAGGVMVVRGFINGSMQNSVSFIKSLSDRGTRAIIDPNAFRLFNVKNVPQIVVISDNNQCEAGRCSHTPLYDKISGNISLEYALENIKNNGEFTKKEATRFLGYLQQNENG